MNNETIMKLAELGYGLRCITGVWWLTRSYTEPVAGPFTTTDDALLFAEKYKP